MDFCLIGRKTKETMSHMLIGYLAWRVISVQDDVFHYCRPHGDHDDSLAFYRTERRNLFLVSLKA